MQKKISIYIIVLFITLQASALFAQPGTNNSSEKTFSSKEAQNKQEQPYSLTQAEKEYLAQKKTIKFCIDPSWLPFEALSNDRHIGMSADYLKLISQKWGIDFQLVPTRTWTETLEKARSRECDILALAMSTPKREKYLKVTKPYIVIPLVIATTKDKPFIADLPDVIHHQIGLTKGYAYIEFLRKEYPEMKIVEFETVHDGLAALEKGIIYGFIDNLDTISYEISNYFSSSIKISGRVNRNWDLGIAVRNDDPVLFGILDKAVRSIDTNAVKKIHSKWVPVTYQHQYNYSLLWKILAAVCVVVLLLVYRYQKIKKFNQKLQRLYLKLAENENSFRSLTDHAHEGVVVVQDKRLVYVNPSMCKMTGYDQDTLLNMETFLPLIAPEARETILANHLKRLAGKASPDRYESEFLKKDGTTYPIELTGVLITWNNKPATLNIISDISERKNAEEAIRFMAHHDSLTELPNRYLLMERLGQSLAQAKRSKHQLGLLFMDLNSFKKVNDTYGHDIGDMLLKMVADRLKPLLRETDTLARMGGDEFVMLLPEIQGKSGVETLIARIDSAFQSPFTLGELTISSSPSVGFSIYPENGDTAEELLRTADQRMYDMKHSKK
ncbi:diguanylate cyclase domain-containing protein [Maridesulfovibrio sp.]|uniref:diguanylate cyclase domain-containing protein n=1 Tax=Maridesulfovibrio sp. TaxID=2795000 RepID=UPI002A18D1BC|nr:diguanylate cyclase [Maridesulfovibrio sp.]